MMESNWSIVMEAGSLCEVNVVMYLYGLGGVYESAVTVDDKQPHQHLVSFIDMTIMFL